MENTDPKDSVQKEQFNGGVPPVETTPATSPINSEKTTSFQAVEELILPVSPITETEEEDDVDFDPHNIDESNLSIEGEEAPAEDYSKYSKAELIHKLEVLLSSKSIEDIRSSVESIKVNFFKKHKADIERLRKESEDAGEEEVFTSEPDPVEEKLKELLKKYRDIKAEYNQKIEAEKQKNLQEKYKIIEEIKELVNRKDSITDTFQYFRELQNKWRSIGVVPQQNIKDLWETYHHYVEIFYDYMKINKELRDLDLKRNFEAKMQLCEKAEALLLEPSVIKSFKALQKLHEQWREVGPVPQESKAEIWERFKTITSKINKAHQDYFEELKNTQQKNLESKTILCERAEEISNTEVKAPKEWETLYNEMIELQKVWRTIGFAPKKDNNRIYSRFRAACDSFFLRKREYFQQTKDEQTNNLQLKTDLCIQAEALKESTEWKATSEDLISLQKKWKEIGPVSRKQSDIIWKRFRAACDYFFERKAKHFNSIDSQYDENLKLKLELISEIESFVPSEDAEQNFEKLKDFQRRWSEIGFVPLKKKEEIQKKYREAINKQFDSLKVDEKRKNFQKYKSKIENLSGKPKGDRKMNSERDKHIHKLKQLENDIVIWENNIGFFAKSKNADAMIAEVRRKIQDAKDEIKLLEDKVKLIDSVDEE
jgi:hypothetical protein